MSLYLVSGTRRYREHEPGEMFEADLDPDVEGRAIKYGAITLIERRTTSLQPGSWRLPPGWQASR